MIAPFFTTYLIRTIAWKTILADQSPVIDVLQYVHLLPDDGRVLATSGAVIAGLTYNFLPFMILPIYASIERLELRLIEAAQGPLRLLDPGIPAGNAADDRARGSSPASCSPSSPPSATTSTPPSSAGRTKTMIGNKIQSLFLVERDYPEAAALSFLMMALILVVVLVYIRLAGHRGVHGRRGGSAPDALAAAKRVAHLRRPGGPLHADSDRGDRGLLLRGDTEGQAQLRLNNGFTLEYWQHAFAIPELNDALPPRWSWRRSSTLISTAIGTLMALALVRYDFFGRRASNLLIILPMATPEIVIGASLLSMFIVYSVALGFTTLLIAHVMFSISFVVVVVRSRLIGFDRSLEEAAA